MSGETMEVPDFWEGKIYVKMTISGYAAGRIHVTPYNGSIDNEDITLHAEHIRIDIPKGIDIRGAAIGVLTDEKEKILAEAHIKVAAVQHKIDDLLQISYDEVAS